MVFAATAIGGGAEAQASRRFSSGSVGGGGLAPLTSLAARAERESDRLLGEADARLRSAVPMTDEEEKRATLLAAASQADSALALRPSVQALYWRTAARGMLADIEGGRRQIDLAAAVHDEALAVIAAEPNHAGAHHVLGRLHAAVMRLGTVRRFLATRILGGGALSHASWESAERHFRYALVREPDGVEHKLELANVLIDTGREAEARPLLEQVVSAKTTDPVVAFLQESARARLAELNAVP